LPHTPGAAVRQILLAMQASIARWAGASEGSHVVSAGAWATRAAQTLVHVPGTVWTGEPRQAGAGERARAILTGAAIQTGVWGEMGERPSLTLPLFLKY
uniref:Uncharacterized protein n=1 Tax=Oryctolagus cuniculus TaxID=9986 RepID=A0A5F9D5C9_RABIT